MRGKVAGIIKDGKEYYITFRVDDVAEVEPIQGAECDIKVTKHREKRSLNANAYMWELCGKIADKLSDDGILFTKEEVYRNAVREVGIYEDTPMIYGYQDRLRRAWEEHGTAWITEIVDYYDDNTVLVRCYYGSSQYDSKQMSRLIDYIIQDCDELGIDHRTPGEIADLISLWETERKDDKPCQKQENIFICG